MTIIAIDFDGTIVSDEYPAIGPEIPYAVEVINGLHDSRFCIIIHSCRVGKYQDAMIEWLRKRGVKFCRTNENCPKHIETYKTDTRKISADLYIDLEKDLVSLFHGPPSWLSINIEIRDYFDCFTLRRCEE